VADVDPEQAGNQPGHRLTLTGVQKRYSAIADWNYSQVSLALPETATTVGPDGPVHWPLHAGQGVEFRAACNAAACLLDIAQGHYLYMTTE
jgi:hypothetical protein